MLVDLFTENCWFRETEFSMFIGNWILERILLAVNSMLWPCESNRGVVKTYKTKNNKYFD